MSRAKIQIRPLAEAVARMGRKTPVAKALTSAEWSELPLALRERAFWSARFAKADVLQAMHDMLSGRLALERRAMDRGDLLVNRENFITEMRDRLAASGYVPPAGKEGSLRDMTSTGRLGLIFDINTAQAQEFARFKAETEDTLDAFPARELYRAEDRQVPRNWRERWQRAGGRLFEGGRMVAAKDDPVWVGISAFGTPFPPFDFNSGMEVRDISRQEAERLGVLAPGEGITPPVVGFNDSLQKSVARYEPGIREAILKDFEGRAALDGEVLKWIGGGDATISGKIGQVGTWKTLNLRPASQIPADDSSPKMAVADARRKLSGIYEVPTPLGDTATFGPNVLEHWEEKGKSKLDVENRLRFLASAEDAIRSPHEIWENERTGTRTFIHVTKDETKTRVLHAWELKDGRLESFVSTSDVSRRGDKHREGRLLYARP